MSVQPPKPRCPCCGNRFRWKPGFGNTNPNSTGFSIPPHCNGASGGQGDKAPGQHFTSATNVSLESSANIDCHNTSDFTTHANNYEPNQCNSKQHERQPSIKGIMKQKISTIFNYSKIELTQPMINLLNRGLNFAVLPLKMDLTQVLVDFKRFERSAIWHEFWYGKEKNRNYKPPIFKKQKRNYPKNYSSPPGT